MTMAHTTGESVSNANSAALYPPRTATDFLTLCAGDWMSLRTLITVSDQEEGWHASERRIFRLTWHAPGDGNSPATGQEPGLTADRQPLGTLALQAAELSPFWLCFQWPGEEQGTRGADCKGHFLGRDGRTGQWCLNGEGVMELDWTTALHRVNERIWFTKANLRLRSRTVHSLDPAASLVQSCAFYSDIRRLPRSPAAS